MTWLTLLVLPLAFGAGDYLAGQFTKKLSPWAVAGITSSVAALGALGWALYTNSISMDPLILISGSVAGIMLLASNVLLYLALSKGNAGVIGAIVSLSIIIPLVFDFFHGELPSTMALIGIGAIVVGVIVIAQPRSQGKSSRAALILALASAVALGFQVVALNRGSSANADMATFVQYFFGALIVGIIGLSTRSLGGVHRGNLPRLTGVGLLFAVGGLCLSISMVATNVAIATAVMLTEPIVLAIMGYFLQKEKLNAAQIGALGVVVAGAIAATLGG